jgi:hypothetical protein
MQGHLKKMAPNFWLVVKRLYEISKKDYLGTFQTCTLAITIF